MQVELLKMTMNIKKYITVAALLAGGVWGTATAQVVYVEDEDKDVVVKDDNGDEETIEVPEAMMQDLDSLLNSYHVQTYSETG